MRTTLARTSIVLTASTLLLAVAGCGGTQEEITALERENRILTNTNSQLREDIEESENDLVEGLLNTDVVAKVDDLYAIAQDLENKIDSILERCNGADWCQSASDYPTTPTTVETLTTDDVEALGNVINALTRAANELLDSCKSSSLCKIATTTTTPKPKPTNPPRQNTTEERDRPECEGVILARALAYDSRGTYEEYEYLMTAAYYLPIDWSMTAGFILDDLSNGFTNSAYNRLALFIDSECPSNR